MSRTDATLRQKRTIPHSTSTRDFENYLPTSPLLSSVELNWQSLVVRSYLELSDLDETVFPGGPDLYLVLITGGNIEVDQRKLYGPWVTHRLHQGDWFLTPPAGEPYALRWRSLSTDPLTTLHLHIDTDLLSRTMQQVIDSDPERVTVLDRTGFQDPLLANIGLSLQQELQYPAQGSMATLYAETAAQMLTVHLLRHYTANKSPIRDYSRKLSSHQMQRLTTFILDHLDQNISLEMLALQVGFSPYYFARLFRQTTGESPHQFVLRQRLSVAQRLLRETDLPLLQLALQVGFPTHSHFTHVFKRHLGMTPLAYRQLQ